MFTEEVLSEIRNKINIVDLVSRYVNLKKVGKNYQGLCPFHAEKTPSFFVNPALNIFKCFGCGEGGDIFKFLQDIEKITFVEAVEKLAKEAGVELPRDPLSNQQYKKRQQVKKVLKIFEGFYHKLLFKPVGKQALDYLLTKRGLSIDFINKFKLGYAPYDTDIILKFAKIIKVDPKLLVEAGILTEDLSARFKNRVMFPLLDNTGAVVGFSGRTLNTSPNVPKYLNTPETIVFKKRFNLFGLFWAKKSISEKNMAIITEGQMDVLSSMQAGIYNIVAPLGTALTETQLMILKRFAQNIAFAFDNDSAGQKALERGVILALKQGMVPYIITLPQQFKDIDELIQSSVDVWHKISSKPVEFFEWSFNRIKELQQQYVHYTELEPEIEKLLGIIVYAPQVRASLLIKELAKILDIEVKALEEKLNEKKEQLEKFNRYEFSEELRQGRQSQGGRIQAGAYLGTSNQANATTNVEENRQAQHSINQQESSLTLLYKQAYNLETYITLLILHYPILSLLFDFKSKYIDFILDPENRGIADNIVIFVTNKARVLIPSYKQKQKISLDILSEAYNNFVQKLSSDFSTYMRQQAEGTKYYDHFLKLATSEPVFETFDAKLIKEFKKVWFKLQQKWLKIKISLVMNALDELEQEAEEEKKSVTQKEPETSFKLSPFLEKINMSVKDLEVSQLNKQLKELSAQLSKVEKILLKIGG